jgi:LacI family transcriptional regulator
MAARKRVLLALNEETLAQPGFLRGVRNYTMLHPDVVTHVQLFLEDPAADRHMFKSLLRHSCPDGVLAHVYWPVADQILPFGIPLVNVDDETKCSQPTVMNDQEQAGRLAAEHLLEQGLSHYAFAPPVISSYAAELRQQGFCGRLRETGHDCAIFGRPQYSKETLRDEALLTWILKLPKPVGVHAYTLALAARLAWACQEGGLRVPGDVALLGGQDHLVLATALEPAISAIVFDDARLGYEGIRLLHNLMRGTRPPRQPLLLPPVRLVARASTDMHSVQDTEIGRIRKWIRENAHRPLTVKDLLAETPLSRRTLERRFTTLTGRTLHDEIETIRMERVQTLLRESNLPLTQVAAQCGYANYVTFSLAFRRFAGTTASAFRRRTALAATV